MVIKIEENEIETSTHKAYLVKIPKSSLKFWFPICKTSQRGGLIYLKFPETWYFKLIQKDGKLNKTVSAYSLYDMFSCIPFNSDEANDSYLKVEEPKKLEMEVKIPDELRND